MSITVRIEGLKELEKKLDGKFLVQPEIEGALDTVAKRGQRGGRGLGAQRNPIGVGQGRLTRVLTSGTHHPRQKGTAWKRKNVGAAGFGRGVLGATAQNALKKAARRMEQRFNS